MENVPKTESDACQIMRLLDYWLDYSITGSSDINDELATQKTPATYENLAM